MDCIFCKIISGDIPSIKIYEDMATMAFMDINPLSEGHALVIPKRHCAGLFDADDLTLAATMAAVRKVALAMRDVLGLDSLNMVQANGPWAKQSVPHMHFHLVPRRQEDGVPLDWDLTPGDMNAIKKLGDAIAEKVR